MKQKIIQILRWSEKYAKTDMVRFASGNFWLSATRVAAVGSGMVLTVVFANKVDPNVYGTYKYIIALVGIFGAFSLNSLGTSVVRAVAQGNKDVVRPLFIKSILWSLPAAGAAAIGSLYYYLNGNAALGFGLLLIALANPFFNSFVVWKSLFVGKGDFKSMAAYSIPGNLASVLAFIGILLVKTDIFTILITYFATNLALSWFMYAVALRKYKVAQEHEIDEETKTKVSETVQYGKHLSILGIVIQIMSYADQLILWHFVGPIQLAIYSFAQAPVREIKNFSENFFPIIFPRYATKTMEEVKKSMGLRTMQMVLVSSAACIAYIIAAPFIFKIFFPKYMASVLASQILALAIPFQAKGLVETLITAHGDVKKKYVTSIATNASRLALLGILIPPYGFIGASIAIVASEAVSAVVYYFAYKRL
ncbi:MAG TPA: oligosaccharide flippase family protein [Candidatus Paceibacterota bacterium]